MKNDFTIDTLGCMDDAEFRSVCCDYPMGSQWQNRKAFNYAAVRLANIQGIRVAPAVSRVIAAAKPAIPCEKQIHASMNC